MFSFIHLLPLFFFLSLATAYDVRPTFNVLSYGANPNRFTENSNAFLRAWHAACASNTGGRVLVPRGSYVLGAVVFLGPCKGPVDFIIKGTLEASDNPVNMFRDHWITFRYLDQLVVTGGGFLYGHGKTVWHLNDCAKNSHCKQLPYIPRMLISRGSNVGPGMVLALVALAQSNVQIRNVTFSEVRGTSIFSTAVKFYNAAIMSNVKISNSRTLTWHIMDLRDLSLHLA
ncbi:exopolygalacturonase-like protein [Tanacetum coccineum]